MKESRPVTLHDVGEVAATTGRILTFRPAVPDIRRLGWLYLSFGLLSAWLVGIGRYWDNERAEPWQALGLGSVAYVFAMAALIWILLYPLKPNNWRYLNILIFVSLTSPPAILYAIPVERFMSLANAQTINVAFLAVVALWRVVLLWLFLRRSAGLSYVDLFVGCFLPLTLVVTVLTGLNLEHVVFNIMSGLAPEDVSANDASYGVLVAITTVSILALPFLAITYLVLIWLKFKSR
ncbi:hypothetical protein [Pelagibius sp. Alg239-R121]|uniref:hypothetical protein n=1 Tax=Pelagibius sp. Alg239-R121 TaxID=2993448 RepID=UPI0024A64DD1|nr:hypothetical protein [Pelagibius sp. Alg239-R121]